MASKFMNKRVFALIALMTVLSTFVYVPIMAQGAVADTINANVEIRPRVLNLRSRGRWITAFIALPEGYSVSDIKISTIRLNDTIPAAWVKVCENRNVLIAKFKRSSVAKLILSTFVANDLKQRNVTLTATGSLYNGTLFEGSDTIRIVWHGKNLGEAQQGSLPNETKGLGKLKQIPAEYDVDNEG